MDDIRLLDLGTVPYLRSQSIYHCVAELMTEDAPDTIVMLVPREPYLCVGYHQDLETRLDLKKCSAMGIPIIRRKLGGGAVYLDNHQLFYQCIFNKNRTPPSVNAIYERFLAAPIEALRRLGLNASLKPPNEIEVGERRIAGTGAGQIREATVVVGNILFDFPHDTMAAVWSVPSKPFRDLARNGLEKGITTLSNEMEQLPAVGTVTRLLVEAYSETLGRAIVPGQLTTAELKHLKTVEAGLLSSDWLHREGSLKGQALKVSARVSVRETDLRLNGSSHRISARMANGVIDELIIYPPVTKLSRAFRGWRSTDPIDGIIESNEHMHADHELITTLREWSEATIN